MADSEDRRLPAGVQLIYADHVMDSVYGYHTTKIVLGLEQGDSDMRPAAIVVMPTPLLFAAALEIVNDLTSAGMVKQMGDRYASVIAHLKLAGEQMRKSGVGTEADAAGGDQSSSAKPEPAAD